MNLDEIQPETGNIRLVILSGHLSGKSVVLPPKVFVIGNGENCHLLVESPLVSKVHCALAADTLGVHIQDLKSENGTLVNGETLKRQQRLTHGDEFEVGPARFRVHMPINPSIASYYYIDPSHTKTRWLIPHPSGSFMEYNGSRRLSELPDHTTDHDFDLRPGNAWVKDLSD